MRRADFIALALAAAPVPDTSAAEPARVVSIEPQDDDDRDLGSPTAADLSALAYPGDKPRNRHERRRAESLRRRGR